MLRPNVLRKKADFNLIYNKGKSTADRYVVVFYKKNGMQINRTAFLASKKVGNSVHRNRARRLMKESLRLITDEISTGFDLIFIARNTINGKKQHDVSKSIRTSLKKIGVIPKR